MKGIGSQGDLKKFDKMDIQYLGLNQESGRCCIQGLSDFETYKNRIFCSL